MKLLDEYRDAEATRRYARMLARITTREWTLMEVCGGQTHSIVRFGIDRLLPPGVTLIHGPGCPVCVTPVSMIDAAIEVAARPGVILTSFGDMLRVPGSRDDLLSARARGADVRIVYTPLDAVRIAEENPDRRVVFFAVGFETTAPANAMAAIQAHRRGLKNFHLLVSHVLVPPALRAILDSPLSRVQGFLAAGHVCAVMGYEEYHPIAARYRVPIVVTGFEPVDILQGVYMLVKQLEEGRAEVENPYQRAVSEAGNRLAQDAMNRVFRVCDREWRGIGMIPGSGFSLTTEFAGMDALTAFDITPHAARDGQECISGLILQGLKNPRECPAFGSRCTPEHPLGATMVSGEGACAAYYKYRRHEATLP